MIIITSRNQRTNDQTIPSSSLMTSFPTGNSPSSSANSMTCELKDFCAAFDSQLAVRSRFELCNIANSLESLFSIISKNKKKNEALKSSGGSKFQKVVDHLESLAQLEARVPRLLDADFLKELSSKFRSKLKTIEEVLSSSKTSKKESELKTGIAEIRSEVAAITSLLDNFDSYQAQQCFLLNHHSRIKEKIHKPIQEILSEVEAFGSFDKLKGAELSTNKMLNNCKQAYETARRHPVLQSTALLKTEAEYIENILMNIISPLQELSSVVSVSSTESIVAVSDEFSEKESAILANMWPAFFVKLLRCSTSEFLVRCGNRGTLEVFLSSILEQHNAIIAANALNDISCGPKLREYVEKLNSVASKFDFELFTAYISDWKVIFSSSSHVFRCLFLSLQTFVVGTSSSY